MMFKVLLLGILATTTMAADYVKPRNYGAMVFPRQQTIYACSDVSLESCGASTDCCTAGRTCAGTAGCCPIGEICTGVPIHNTIQIDTTPTPTDGNSDIALTSPTAAATTADTSTSANDLSTITAAPTTATTQAAPTPATSQASTTASSAKGAGVPVAVSGASYFLVALGCVIAGFF